MFSELFCKPKIISKWKVKTFWRKIISNIEFYIQSSCQSWRQNNDIFRQTRTRASFIRRLLVVMLPQENKPKWRPGMQATCNSPPEGSKGVFRTTFPEGCLKQTKKPNSLPYLFDCISEIFSFDSLGLYFLFIFGCVGSSLLRAGFL